VRRPATGRAVRQTQEERSTATRGRLLDATIECLIDLGYADTTTTVIAERAGVSRGAQLHHYPTKAELVAAAVDRLSERMGEELRREAATLPAGGDRVGAAIDVLWSRFDTPLFLAWIELLVAARTDAVLRETLRATEARLRRAVRARCREVFGPLADGRGFEPAVELTLHLMAGMALERSLSGGRRREAASLAAWKSLLPSVLEAR